MDKTLIRPYRKIDRPFIRSIAWETAFIGESADAFFTGQQIFADFLTTYFTDYEPESCFVVEDEGRVVGYLIGCKNTKNLNKVFLIKILPLLLARLIFSGVLFKKKNILFFWHCGISFLKGEFKIPRFPGIYRATFHINIRKGFQGMGFGSRMILTYLDYLEMQGKGGVYLSTMSDKASQFFKNQGFELFYQTQRSYFRYILGRDIAVYTFIKKL